MSHSDFRIPLQGGLKGSLPNVLVRGEEVELNIANQVFGAKVAASAAAAALAASLTVTDGTTTVAGVTNLVVSGATVTGPSPNATITVTGGGGGGTGPGGVGTGLYYWFQGDQLTGAGGTGIPQLINSAPNVGHIIPANVNAGASGATVGAAALNALNVAVFIATSNGRYTIPQIPPTLVQSTCFIVVKPTSASGIYNFICGPAGSYQYGTDGSGHFNIVDALVAQIATSTSSISSATWYQNNVTYNSYTGAYAFRTGRAADGSGTHLVAINNPTTVIGYNSSGVQDMDGSIAELIIFNRVLTSTEITDVENYLFAKWGV